MPRLNRLAIKILEAVKEKPKSMRELQKELGVNWNAIRYHLKIKEDNLVREGCLSEIRNVGETTNRAQDMYLYKKGERYEDCIRKYHIEH